MKFIKETIKRLFVLILLLMLIQTDCKAEEPGEIYTYTGIEDCRCYEKAETESNVICMVSSGAKLKIVGEEKGFLIIKTKNDKKGYIVKEKMKKGELYAAAEAAIDLRGYIKEAEYSLDFATQSNITGTALYPAIPLMEKETAVKLRDASNIFSNDGYVMRIYDAYRPKSAQYALWEAIKDNRYIANPNSGGSWHNVGRAVDMTLIEKKTGKELEMPTLMHEFDETAARYSRDKWTKNAKNNVDYMTEIMTSVGFTTIETEWWHFEYLGQGGYMDRNLSYSSIRYEPAS